MFLRWIIGASLACAAFGQKYAPQPVPASNPVTLEKIALGKKLFFDTRLSSDGKISCSSCHDSQHAFSDPRRFSLGVNGQQGVRHSPAIIGRGWGQVHFWDGRAPTLEDQILRPITDPTEMGMTIDRVVQVLCADPEYRDLTEKKLVEAIASYVRTIRSEGSRFDRFLANEEGAYSQLEIDGLLLFENQARCYQCHGGQHLTDEAFHNTGIAWRDGRLVDEGRARITGKAYHRGAFKTPSLREIPIRAPYMHDGSLATLEDVVEFYDRGGNANPYLDENMSPLNLTPRQKQALLAFLRTLSGKVVDGIPVTATSSAASRVY